MLSYHVALCSGGCCESIRVLAALQIHLLVDLQCDGGRIAVDLMVGHIDLGTGATVVDRAVLLIDEPAGPDPDLRPACRGTGDAGHLYAPHDAHINAVYLIGALR